MILNSIDVVSRDVGAGVVLNPPAFVLERRVNRPLAAVQAALRTQAALVPDATIALVDDAELRVSEPLYPVLGFYDVSWRAGARLLGAPLYPTGRRRVVARVEIEVDAWSCEATRLQLRPMATHPERWRAHHLERYFALAHDAADRTARRLSQIAREPEAPRAYELVGARTG